MKTKTIFIGMFAIICLVLTVTSVNATTFVQENFENNSVVNWLGGAIESTQPINGTYSGTFGNFATYVKGRLTGGANNSLTGFNVTLSFNQSLGDSQPRYIGLQTDGTGWDASNRLMLSTCNNDCGTLYYYSESGTLIDSTLDPLLEQTNRLTIEINATKSGSTSDTVFMLHLNGASAGWFDTVGSTSVTDLHYLMAGSLTGDNPIVLDDIIIYDQLVAPSGSIVLSDLSPANNESINTTTTPIFTYGNFTYSTNCTLVIDDVSNSTIEYSAGDNTLVSFNPALVDGNYTVYISCEDNTTQVNTSSSFIYVDLISPNIYPINWTNNQAYYDGQITGTFNFTDESNLFSYNVSVDDLQIDSKTNINNVSYLYNLNLNATDYLPGQHTITMRVADGHTDEKLKGDYKVKNGWLNDYIKFEFDDVYEEGSIKVYQKDGSWFDTWNAEKKIDRYSFKFKPNKLKSKYTFIVEAEGDIHIINNYHTKYKSWLIYQNHWLDFMPYTDVTFKRVNDNSVEVTVNGVDPNQEEIVFNSIGDLNIVEVDYTFNIVGVTESFEPVIQNNTLTTYQLDINDSSQSGDVYSPLLELNGTNVSATFAGNIGDVSRYTYDYTPNFGSLPTSIDHKWYFNLTSYKNLSTQTQQVYVAKLDNCTLYNTKFLNITIRDELTNALVPSDVSYAFNYMSSGNSASYSAAHSGLSTYDFCIDPVYANFTTDVQFTYNADGYNQRTYADLNITADNATTQFTVYLAPTNSTTAIDVQILDEDDSEIVGYTIEAQKYDLATDTYSLVSSKISNPSGKVQFNLDVSSDEYRFVVKNPSGEIVYTEAKQELIETSYLFRIVLGELPESITIKLQQLSYDFTATKSTGLFTVNWDDANDYISSARLAVSLDNVSSSLVFYDQSSTNDVDTLSYTINSSNLGTYYGRFYVTSSDDGKEYILETLTLDYREEWQVFGVESLFMAFFFIGTMMFLGISISPELSVALTVLGMIIFWWMGFVAVALTGLVSICVSFLVIIVRIHRRYN